MKHTEIKKAYFRGQLTAIQALGEVKATLTEIEENSKIEALEMFGNEPVFYAVARTMGLNYYALIELRDELKKEIAKKDNAAPQGSSPEQPECLPATVQESTGKIMWKWGVADMYWLYNSLYHRGAIGCSESTFAAAFIRKNGKPMPLYPSVNVKGSHDPKRDLMREMRGEIIHHEPEEDSD